MSTQPQVGTLEVGVLCAMGAEGDSRIQWDKTKPEEVGKARARFDELRKKGFLAYKVDKAGKQGEVLSVFDENAERIILAPAFVGG